MKVSFGLSIIPFQIYYCMVMQFLAVAVLLVVAVATTTATAVNDDDYSTTETPAYTAPIYITKGYEYVIHHN